MRPIAQTAEYEGLFEAVGVQPITLEPGGPVRLNALTARGSSPNERLGALRAVAAVVLRRPLTAYEDKGTRAVMADLDETNGRGCAGVLERAPGRGGGHPLRSDNAGPTIPAVVERLLNPPERVARVRVEEMALALGELCEGELAGLFSGDTSAGISLDGSVVVLDLGSLYTSAGLAVAMVCAGAWLRSTVAKADGRQRLLIVDEA